MTQEKAANRASQETQRWGAELRFCLSCCRGEVSSSKKEIKLQCASGWCSDFSVLDGGWSWRDEWTGLRRKRRDGHVLGTRVSP